MSRAAAMAEALATGPYSSASAPCCCYSFSPPDPRSMAQARFTPERSLQPRRDKITTFLASVIFFERIAALPEFESADMSSIVFAQISGARVNPALLQAAGERGVVRCQYTEAGGAWAARDETAVSEPESRPGRHVQRVCHQGGKRRLRTRRHPGRNTGAQRQAVRRGYWNNEEANKDAFRNGWLHTGDLGVLDERGNLTFIDRPSRTSSSQAA